MKKFKNQTKWVTIISLTTLLLLLFGCSKQGPITPEAMESMESSEMGSFAKGGPSPSSPAVYPQYGSCIIEYFNNKNIYRGGSFSIENGSNFSITTGSLTPPQGTSLGAPVEITMLVEKKSSVSELVFTFGPSGCQFNPPAEVTLDWTDLGIEEAELFYIDENGSYIPQNPASISIANKKMVIYIDHFSRYALGDSPN